MEERSDEKSVLAARAGDRDAYADLIGRHYRHVFLVCLGIVGNVHDAEDIAQDAMLRGFQQITRLHDGSRFGHWIVKIAKNLCINLVRRRRRARITTEQNGTQLAQRTTDDDDLQRAIARLPRDIRLPLVMYYFDGRSVKSVAESLNMSTSGVYSKLRTAVKQLHELLVEQGDAK